LQVRLSGRAPNTHAIGAVVRVTAGDHLQARAVLSQSIYYSADDLRVHFGLGDRVVVDALVVAWPSGDVERFEVPAVDRVIDVRQGTGVPIARGAGRR
jgi:hypothetical protein